jgi:transmembrane sensor
MNPISPSSSPSPSPAADELAALWAVRLEGAPLTPDDHTALQAWLAADPAHAGLLADYRQLSYGLDQQLPALVKAGRLQMPEPERRAPRRSGSALAWIFGLAGAGAAAVLAIAVWRGPASHLPDLMITPKGSRRSFTMADGTEVELNAATRFLIEKSVAERRVRLDDGEAYFHVAKDRSHPFIVETPAGSVRVTGTVFDVRSESPAQLEVTVVEGSVQVRPQSAAGGVGEAVMLKAGDRLAAAPRGVALVALSRAEVADALAWRQGRAVFSDVTVADALAQFSRYHDKVLTVSPAAAGEKVGGVYRLDDLDGFLAGLETGIHLRVDPQADGSVKISLQSELHPR